jgi:hypothetical protein
MKTMLGSYLDRKWWMDTIDYFVRCSHGLDFIFFGWCCTITSVAILISKVSHTMAINGGVVETGYLALIPKASQDTKGFIIFTSCSLSDPLLA